MSQIGFESAAAAFGIDLDALKTAAPGTTMVTPQTDIADLAGAPTQADFNGLLAKLRDAGVLIPA